MNAALRNSTQMQTISNTQIHCDTPCRNMLFTHTNNKWAAHLFSHSKVSFSLITHSKVIKDSMPHKASLSTGYAAYRGRHCTCQRHSRGNLTCTMQGGKVLCNWMQRKAGHITTLADWQNSSARQNRLESFSSIASTLHNWPFIGVPRRLPPNTSSTLWNSTFAFRKSGTGLKLNFRCMSASPRLESMRCKIEGSLSISYSTTVFQFIQSVGNSLSASSKKISRNSVTMAACQRDSNKIHHGPALQKSHNSWSMVWTTLPQ